EFPEDEPPLTVDALPLESPIIFLNFPHVMPLAPERIKCGQSFPHGEAVLCWITLEAGILYFFIRLLVKSAAFCTAFLYSPSLFTAISIPIELFLYVLPAYQHCALSGN